MLSWLRLLAVALVVGFASQTPIQHPEVSACPAELADLIRDDGWSLTPVLTCQRPDDDGGALASLRDGNPHLGEPCEDVEFDQVHFMVRGDSVTATFALFGGLSHGTLRLSSDQAAMIGTHVAYVAEVHHGSYEPNAGRGRTGLSCRLDLTYHFDCPPSGQMDRLCLIWLPHRSDDG